MCGTGQRALPNRSLTPASPTNFLLLHSCLALPYCSTDAVVGMLCHFGFVALVDVCRHFLLLLFAEDVSIITFNVNNPFSGKPVSFSNQELASSLYWTSLIFIAQATFQMFTGGFLGQTVALTTNYRVRDD